MVARQSVNGKTASGWPKPEYGTVHPAINIAIGWAIGAALALLQFVLIYVVQTWRQRRRGETPLVPHWGPGNWRRLPFALLMTYLYLLVTWPVVLPATIPLFWAHRRLGGQAAGGTR
jgi:hypothetical protein